MIKRIIRNLRRKPKTVRNQFALFFAGTVTALVAFVWAAQIPDRLLSSSVNDRADSDKYKRSPSLTGLFDVFKKQTATVKDAESDEDRVKNGLSGVGTERDDQNTAASTKKPSPDSLKIDQETILKYQQDKKTEPLASSTNIYYGQTIGSGGQVDDGMAVNPSASERAGTEEQVVRIVTVKSSSTSNVGREQ